MGFTFYDGFLPHCSLDMSTRIIEITAVAPMQTQAYKLPSSGNISPRHTAKYITNRTRLPMIS
ncbi:MAG: hypothetical protein J6C02_04075 [Peptococcaceae bacterium]|nr:hypothetical protein [Peptococcaceae bacterium]